MKRHVTGNPDIVHTAQDPNECPCNRPGRANDGTVVAYTRGPREGYPVGLDYDPDPTTHSEENPA